MTNEPINPSLARNLFHVATGNRWMDLGLREAPRKMLFGEFWFLGEICILFADTNIGKSVLAVQIANSLSRRSAIGPFANQVQPQKVLYIDFELTTRQFADRYTTPNGSFDFSANFFRADFNYGAELPPGCNSWHQFVMAGIEYKLQLIRPAVLIIDNITCLRGGTENTLIALQLMKLLKLIRKQYHLSILVLAHTPKRVPGKPIGPAHLQGSKQLLNFADSAFAIGRSSLKEGLCYLKQIKQRSITQTYGAPNVCLCSLHHSRGFLRFQFHGTAPEAQHLQSPAAIQRRQLIETVTRLRATGHSQRHISQKLRISLGLVNKILKDH